MMNDDEKTLERIAALERTVEVLYGLFEQAIDVVGQAHLRGFAIQEVLQDSGVLTAAAVTAKIQEMEVDSTAELELGEHEDYRELRRCIREAGGEIGE